MTQQLIIVSPHFPPTNAADHQRVRLTLPYFRELGWKTTVVAVDPGCVHAPIDPFLETTVPSDIEVERVRGLSTAWSGIPGLGSLAYRCRFALRRALCRQLTNVRTAADTLVYFSTTQFPVHGLIPELKRRFNVRVAMDYQDPWVNDYYEKHPKVTPPGGRLKYAMAHHLARWQERAVAPFVDGFTAVSAAYRNDFHRRYPALAAKPFLVLPFGAAETDFEALARSDVRQNCFDPHDGYQHWVYVGRGGSDMAFAVTAFFRAFAAAKERYGRLDKTRIHFIGTDYAPTSRARPSLSPLAREFGLESVVRESPGRIPYGEALRCLQEADALIVPGSDDPGYTASKLYPYILAGKPMLTIFHRQSSVNRIVHETRCAAAAVFGEETSELELAAAIDRLWFEPASYSRAPDTDWYAFQPYTARSMTAQLAAFFDFVQRPC